MANTKSARKMVRVIERRRQRNRSIKSALKTYTTKAEKAIAAGEPEPACEATLTALRALDRAAQKGVIHRNNAARRKSRLAKRLNALPSQAASAS